MRNSLFKIVLLVIWQIICSCNRVNTQDPSITSINIEAGYNKMEEIKLSQFTDNIKYVKLEELAESLTEYDNPVLMFVTFK